MSIDVECRPVFLSPNIYYFGTTQLEKTVKNINLGALRGVGLFCDLTLSLRFFCCSHNLCAGELPRSASSHFMCYVFT